VHLGRRTRRLEEPGRPFECDSHLGVVSG
jgi:hypothetical protein